MTNNPVQQLENGRWIYYHETWATHSGEYNSEMEAKIGLREYGRYLEASR